MASIRPRKETGLLVIDFRYRGKRCREQTLLADTPVNRARLEKLVERMERTMLQGTFVYAEFFPGSPMTALDRTEPSAPEGARVGSESPQTRSTSILVTPSFKDFADQWFDQSTPRWRKRNIEATRDMIDLVFVPQLGNKALHELTRADLLSFRAEIAKRPGRGGQLISAKRVNKIMSILASILNEGCDRFGLTPPSRGIKPLKQKRSEVFPFSVTEINALIAAAREDYRAYITVRSLTGMRTGEVDGLQWDDIDFERELIHIERTHSRGGDGETKTELSRRVIPMVPAVKDALQAQLRCKQVGCPWVFHSPQGNPIDANNFANRVWYPLLRYLGFKKRPPYQMRHTAATLMLAAGENPEWVARILGHSTTEMLFRVYSRYVPNLTRNDGGAYAGLLTSKLDTARLSANPTLTPDISSLSAEQRSELLKQLNADNQQGKSP
jgi:integrase